MQLLKKIVVGIITFESRLVLWKYRPFVVAVTGSVGKTSAKDAVYAVLKNESGYVRKSEKSLNSEIGLPLTILGLPNAWYDVREWLRNIKRGLGLIWTRAKYPDCLVLEIGADHPGDIRRVAKWLRPHIAVITKISDTPVHVEFFRSPREVFEEKAALARAVRKNGTAILFADDEKLKGLGNELQSSGVSVVYYGLDTSAAVRGGEFSFEYVREEGAGDDRSGELRKALVNKFKLFMDGEHEVVFRNPLGRTGMYPLLAAAAVGKVRNIPVDKIVRYLGDVEAPKGRMNVLRGVNGCTVIDDSYNSSPDAALSAVSTLGELTCSGRKIAVLGDMMELGKYSAEEHRKIGRILPPAVDYLVTVGQRSRATAEEALKNGLAVEKVKSFDNSVEAGDFVMHFVKPGDIVLVKGSQSMRMERVTKDLLEDSSCAAKVLVRQEREWLEKK